MAYEILQDKSMSFAIRIVNMYKHLKTHHQNYGLGDQVLRSGTSIGANISEAIYSQSVADNISKFHIALKEASETRYWIKLLTHTNYITTEQGNSLIADCSELISILITTIKSLKAK